MDNKADTRENPMLRYGKNCRLIAVTFFTIWISLSETSVYAREDEVLLGMSTALSGPAEELGQNMRLGVEIRLASENAKGGVKGRRIRLLAWDDGYEPEQTVPNMRDLIEIEHVLAVIGNVGTPTAISALPIASEEKTLLFAPYTGAGVLRKIPPNRYVINYRASYAEETSAMVDALINHAGLMPQEIAFFTQRDGYGDAGYVGGISALKKFGLKSETAIIHTRYERNTLVVENALADILLADPTPRAVIMVGAYAPSARFIKLARGAGLEALFLNVSFVGAEPIARELGTEYDGVIVTQVVPHPEDTSLPIVDRYQQDLLLYGEGKRSSFGSLEGYLAAEIFIKALSRLDNAPNRENIIDALEGLGEFSIGTGHKLHFDKNDHQASHRVWPTVLRDGKFVPFQWADIPLLLKR
ncbi:ABC transporter substrate-binding protein [Kiloniella antarctica]|uniref:ABC transporter substrate-binding protein n=1 Tax=Kiloniella antarctica TaxID=1550907 RepID=A0ABW5BHD9_9PROT